MTDTTWSELIPAAVTAHCDYMEAASRKQALYRALDGGEDKGPEHTEVTRRIKELRSQGHNV